MHPPLFLDDAEVTAALDAASDAAIHRLAALLPELGTVQGELFRHALRAHLADLLTGRLKHQGRQLPRLIHGEDAFGDPFSLADLPLPRTGTGYAVQRLDTDTLLDRSSGEFLPVRDPALSGLFDSFDAARTAARHWLTTRSTSIDEPPLAIVPAYFDQEMDRHVLIYGVLTQSP
ncbi:MAG: hypothetical protein ACM31P_11095 [Actinomycetota bacterium]